MRLASSLYLLAGVLALGACGETVQTVPVGGARTPDMSGWEANNSAYLARGWTPGDRAAWETQLRARAQAQNDFAPR